MSRRIGLGVSRADVRALMLSDGAVIWKGSATLDGDTSLADAVRSLLARAPQSRFRQTTVVAALGPASSQMKRLHGLPDSADLKAVSQALRANVSRFFLVGQAQLSPPVAYRNGAWWGAVYHESLVADIERACDQLGLRFAGCVPAAAALARLVTDGCVEWSDADVHSSVAVEKGKWIDVRRDRPGLHPAELVPVLKAMGDDAHYADAFAAASCSKRAPLLLRASAQQADVRRRLVLRFALGIACIMLFALALAAPGLRATRQLEKDHASLAALQSSTASYASATRDLYQATAALDEIARFTVQRRSAVHLFAALSRALPDSAAVVTIRVDSVGGSATLLARSAAAAMARLEASNEIEAARVSGSVTRETVGGIQLQRIAIRFRVPVRASPAARKSGR